MEDDAWDDPAKATRSKEELPLTWGLVEDYAKRWLLGTDAVESALRTRGEVSPFVHLRRGDVEGGRRVQRRRNGFCFARH